MTELDVDGWLADNTVDIDHSGYHGAVDELEKLIEEEAPETKLQAHIEKNRFLLSQFLPHCHHVFPKVRLGSEYEADFFCLEIPSSNVEWRGVEIETSKKKVITKTGRKRAELEHALQQVRDWRVWVRKNLDYAQRRKSAGGIGLEHIRPDFIGTVVIGRRQDFNDEFQEIRKELRRSEFIEVWSWDSLVKFGRKRAEILCGPRNRIDN